VLSLEPEHRGPTEPLRSAPPRRPGSARRTSTIDVTWPDGFDGEMSLHGRARDLRTPPSGGAEVVAVAELDARVTPDRVLAAIDGSDERLQQLVGTWTFRGFRTATAAALPELSSSTSPLRLLLDDLPPALLVSGFALLAADALAGGSRDPQMLESQIDICAGWARDTGMVRFAQEHGGTPTPVSVPSPPLGDPDDGDAWHDAPLPAPPATRRRRLLDVSGDEDTSILRVDALFRDSHVGPDGIERSFHEYAVQATVDASTRAITTIDARAGVLPWHECPAALASAGRVVGTSIDDLRPQVRATFRGTSTCTHLNDVFAAIGDTAVLLDLL
jgi:hypothetical protein